MSPPADANILARLRKGDSKALDEVFAEYLTPLVRFAEASLGRSEYSDEAADIVSDVLVALWERREEIGEVKNLRAYLYRSVHYQVLNRRRSEKRTQSRIDSFAAIDESPGTATHEALASEKIVELEGRKIIWDTVDKLREPLRTVAILRWSHGSSFAEIAEIMGIGEAAARAHASRALAALRAVVPDLLR